MTTSSRAAGTTERSVDDLRAQASLTSGGASGGAEDRGGTRLCNQRLLRRTPPPPCTTHGSVRSGKRSDAEATSRSLLVVPVCRDAGGSRAATILPAVAPASRNTSLHTHTPTHSVPQERSSKYSDRCETDTVPSPLATHPGDDDPRAATDRNRLVTEACDTLRMSRSFRALPECCVFGYKMGHIASVERSPDLRKGIRRDAVPQEKRRGTS